MGIRNPYTNRSTIDDQADFYGRKRELHDIYSRILGGQSVSLVGERRTGKSSILQALNFPRERKRFRIPPKVKIIHVDLQYVSDAEEQEFLELLLDKAEEELQVDAGPPKRNSLRLLAKEVVRKRSQHLVICLDEFDVLLNNRLITLDFFAYLRAWSSEFRIRFVGASKEGGIERMLESSETGSAFLNVFGSAYVGPFESSEAEELIRRPAQEEGVEFSDADVNRVVLLGGFHPYYLQVACSYLFDLRLAGASDEEVDSVLRQKFSHEAISNLGYLFENLSIEEQMALSSFALGNKLKNETAEFRLRQKGILMDWNGQLRIFSRVFEDLLRAEMATLAASDKGTECMVEDRLLKR